MFKKVIVTVVAVSTLLSVCAGCSGAVSEEQIDAALTHMEEKFGGSFEYTSRVGAIHGGNGVKMLVSGESMPEAVLVEVSKDEDGSFAVRDNGLAVKYGPDVEAMVQELADNIFETAVVYNKVPMTVLSPDLAADASFEDYYRDPGTKVTLTMAIPKSQFDDMNLSVFASRVAWYGVHSLIQFVVVEDDEYSSLDEETLERIIDARKYDCYAVITTRDGELEINIRRRAK